MSDKKKRTSGAPSNGQEESRSDKFRRLANRRVAKALKAVGQIATLGNSRVYDYTPDQVANIMAALKAKVAKVERAFQGIKEEEETFSV